MLTILIGMSASGKDAILRELVANHGFREIVTTTTRPMRKGEVNGKDYNFISRKEFEKGISEGRFFEYRSYNTIWNGKEDVWYYGTPKMQLNPEQDYVAIVDVQGAKDYVSYFGKYDCFVVQVNASEEVRTKRAKSVAHSIKTNGNADWQQTALRSLRRTQHRQTALRSIIP